MCAVFLWANTKLWEEIISRCLKIERKGGIKIKQEIKIYDVVFPVWLILIFPPSAVLAFIVNYFIDSLVLKFAARRRKLGFSVPKLRKHGFFLCLLGFACDYAGLGLMFFMSDLCLKFSEMRFNMVNPYRNLFSFITMLSILFLVAVLIYLVDLIYLRMICKLQNSDAKYIAFRFAVFTAPYLFLIPNSK